MGEKRRISGRERGQEEGEEQEEEGRGIVPPLSTDWPSRGDLGNFPVMERE